MWDPQLVPDLCDLRTTTFGKERKNCENAMRSDRERWWIGATSRLPVLRMQRSSCGNLVARYTIRLLVPGDDADPNQALENVLGATLAASGSHSDLSRCSIIFLGYRRKDSLLITREQRRWIGSACDDVEHPLGITET